MGGARQVWRRGLARRVGVCSVRERADVNLPYMAGLSNLRMGVACGLRSDCRLFSSVHGRGCISTATHPPKRWPPCFVPALRCKPTPFPARGVQPYLTAVATQHLPISTRPALAPSPITHTMYDHPPQPASTARLARASSTKSHISSLMPLHTHHTHSSRSKAYQPNTRQADISRLLDPAYASSSTSAHSSTANVRAAARAYVDHTGEMHDPDYRDFPVLPPRHHQKNLTKPRRANSAHSRITSSTSSAARPDRYKTYPLVARPDWERGWATEVEDLDEEEEAPSSYEGGVRSPFSSSSSSSERTPSSRRASLPPSVYTYTPSSYFFSEPVSTTSSPVDSLEEEENEREQSPFDDVAEETRFPGNTSRTAASILRKMKRSSSGSTVPVVASRSGEADGEDKENQHEMHYMAEDDLDEVYVYSRWSFSTNSTLTARPLHSPSCTHILSRQLRALNLRLRFGVFHAKRRLSISRRKKSSSLD